MVLRKNEAVKYTELGRVQKGIPKQKRKKGEVKISKATGDSEKVVKPNIVESFNASQRIMPQNISSNLLRTIVETDLEIQRRKNMMK